MKWIGVSRTGRFEPPPALGQPRRTLVAGIGNVFFGDDGFGVEVVRRLLAERRLPEGVQAIDFGVRGVQLAIEIADGAYDGVILVSALPRGERPGTLSAIEQPVFARADADGRPDLSDAHGLTPAAVLSWLRRFGGRCSRVVIIGCEPESVDESIGLSGPVAAAIDDAMRMVYAEIARMNAVGLRVLV